MRRRRAEGDSSIARRLPGFDARHATRRARRTRRLVFLALFAGCAAVLALYFAGDIGGSTTSLSTMRRSATGTSLPARHARPRPMTRHAAVTLSASLFPVQLRAPLSDEALLPAATGDLVIMGGTTSGGTAAQGVFTFATSNGALSQMGDLTTPLADQSAAVVLGQDMAFGGDSPAPVSTVQGLAAPSPSAPQSQASPPPPVARVVGSLPEPRAQDTAVTLGPKTYIVGGDNGNAPVGTVLSTSDGASFEPVATLPVPVRFAAVAALGRSIYVFGGEASTAPGTWSAVADIQRVDTVTHRATILGHLPQPLSEASAATVDGQILLFGGIGASGSSAATGTAAASPAANPTDDSAGALPTGPALRTIWRYQPSKKRFTALGQLPVAVARTAVAVLGSTAWLVGGESGGTPVSAVQSVVVSVPVTHVAHRR